MLRINVAHHAFFNTLIPIVAILLALQLIGCDECKTSLDCGAGEICVDGKCKKKEKEEQATDTAEGETAPVETATDTDPHTSEDDTETATGTETETDSVVTGCKDPEKDCPEATECVTYSCEDDKCVSEYLNGASCADDGNECTNNVCSEGECVANPINGTACASDDNECTNDVCVNGTCEHRPQSGISCKSDGNPCTEDICEQGVCGVPLDGVSCGPDTNPCTTETCKSGVCETVALVDDTPCDDSLWCNGSADRCFEGNCIPREDAAPCESSASCIDVSCSEPATGETEGTCVQELLSDISCDDGLYCNGTDVCDDGVCVHSDAPCTESLGTCVRNVCDESEDSCVAENVTTGEPCIVQDGLLCNGVEHCEEGECVAGAPYCPVFNDCTQNICTEGPTGEAPTCAGIESANDGETCTTTVPCDGQGDRYCIDGVCAHGETPACAPREQDGNLCTRYTLCFEEDFEPVCQLEEDNMNGFGLAECGETVEFTTVSSNNEIVSYAGDACPGSFEGGEAVVALNIEDGDFTVSITVEKTTMPEEELYMFLVTDPCDAMNACLDSSTTTLSGNKPSGSSDIYAIVIDGSNGNRGHGTVTLTCETP